MYYVGATGQRSVRTSSILASLAQERRTVVFHRVVQTVRQPLQRHTVTTILDTTKDDDGSETATAQNGNGTKRQTARVNNGKATTRQTDPKAAATTKGSRTRSGS